jgi:hypothetical protein
MSISREGILKHKEIFDGWLAGGEVEFYSEGMAVWLYDPNPSFRPEVKYRIKETKDSFDWDALHPHYKFIVRDEYGDAYAYEEKPIVINRLWREGCSCTKITGAFASYKRGTCDWTDSLIERPESKREMEE